MRYSSLIDEYIELLVEEALATVELGNKGELFVKERLSDRKYRALLSAASRTPSDVWDIADMGNYYHIMLIQVKTTKGDRPAELTQENVNELKTLASFVVQRLKKSSKVPKDFSDKPLVLSIGYSGIVLSGDQAHVDSATCYYMWYADNLANNLDGVRAQVQTAHRLKV